MYARHMVRPWSKKMNPTRLLIVGLSCLSVAQSSMQPRDRSAKKSHGRGPIEVLTTLQVSLENENFCATQFDLKKNWELNHPFILQRERGLEECKTWDIEKAVGQEIQWNDEVDDGLSYYPLELKESELENQIHPQASVISHILAQYRKDLGFSTAENFDEPNANAPEVLRFVSCLAPEPSEPLDAENSDEDAFETSTIPDETSEQKRFRKNREDDKKMFKRLAVRLREERQRDKFNEIIEAYSFLKYLGIITAEITCEAFSAKTKITSVIQFKNYYKEELGMFTGLNWDYLDLTPFEYQYFPIADKITKRSGSSSIVSDVSSPLMMPLSIEILKATLKYIKFHNPRTLEGRKMLLFQRLYRRYHVALGSEADQLYIDWSHCIVTNWPERVSRLDLYRWADEDVTEMNRLLDAHAITFEKAPSSKKQTKTYKMLGQKEPFSFKIPIKIDFDSIEGKECVLSDDEDICGGELTDYSRETSDKVSALRSKVLDADKADYERHHKLFFAEPVAEMVEQKSAATLKPSSSSSIKSISVLVESDKPANPSKRRHALARALETFRNTSGKPHADQIDWSLTNLSILQNHILPFSLDFETEGDVLTLKNLMKSNCLKFNNLDLTRGRGVNLYQILYKKYFAVVGLGADEYFIKWKDVEISGFPEGVIFDYNKWTKADIESIGSCLDRITFTAKSKNSYVETSEPVLAPFPDNLARGKRRIVKRKPVSVEKEVPSLLIEALDQKSEKRKMDSVNGFGDLTAEELNLLVARLNGSLQKFMDARADSAINDRSRRIYSEIIRGLDLFLIHTNNEAEAPLVSVQDIHDFVSFCRNCLQLVGADGSMNESDVREFVVRSIRFRAILFGATPIPENNRKKYSNISRSMISSSDLFSSLLSPEPHWDIGVLEHFLDSEEIPIFGVMKSKRDKRRK